MEQDPMFNDSENKVKVWIQENMRVIVSVFIVVAIAMGIYSYSQRTQTLSDDETSALLETKGDSTSTDQNAVEDSVKAEVNSNTAPEISRETEASFIEMAERGDGTTHLARRALSNYLEKNADSSLSAEQKVYIEDFLRKNSGFQGHVRQGTSIEFSKSLISQAIEKSKTLNERQLTNLKKYTGNVIAFR